MTVFQLKKPTKTLAGFYMVYLVDKYPTRSRTVFHHSCFGDGS